MSEHLFSFSDGFQMSRSSTQQSATTNNLAVFYLILAIIRFYGNIPSGYLRIKFIRRIKLNTEIPISTQKLKVRSSQLRKENLPIWIKSQKLRSKNTIVMEHLTLDIIKTKSIRRRKSTRRVIPTLALIKNVCEVHLLQTGWSLCN